MRTGIDVLRPSATVFAIFGAKASWLEHAAIKTIALNRIPRSGHCMGDRRHESPRLEAAAQRKSAGDAEASRVRQTATQRSRNATKKSRFTGRRAVRAQQALIWSAATRFLRGFSGVSPTARRLRRLGVRRPVRADHRKRSRALTPTPSRNKIACRTGSETHGIPAEGSGGRLVHETLSTTTRCPAS